MPGSEDQDELFAEIALGKEWLTPDRIRDARKAQLTLAEVGLERRLWQVCEERAYISAARVRAIQRAMIRDRGVRARIAGYEIIERVGRGGMGQVFRARQISVNRIVALKALSAGLARDIDYVRRFMREAKLAGRLDHRNIVRVLNFGEDGGRYYIVMEFIEGRSVAQFISREGRLPVDRAIEIAIQAARGLSHAHDCGVIHRDIKPSNILIHVDGGVKVTDLGIAREAGSESSASLVIIGTPAYVSPEQVQTRSADARSDVYSLGATLFHMLAGAPPFEGATAYEVVSQHISSPPPSIEKRRQGLPAGLDAVVRKMMAKRPPERYQSMQEVEQDLEAVQRGERPAALLKAPARRRAIRERKRRAGFLVAATGSLILGVGLLGLLSGRRPGHVRGKPGAEVLLLGRIWDRDTDMPLAGVRVALDRAGAGALTDCKGVFRIRAAGPGRHRLTLGKKGYRSAALTVETSGPTLWTDSYVLAPERPASRILRRSFNLAPGQGVALAGKESDRPDLRLASHDPETGRLDLRADRGMVLAGEAPLSVWRQAPQQGYAPRLDEARQGDVFFLRTRSGDYAKLRALCSRGVKRPVFQCALQENGGRRFPHGPLDLKAKWSDDFQRLTWEDFPGATRYTVYRRTPWRPFEKLRALPRNYYIDRRAEEDALYVYAVSAHGEAVGDTDAAQVTAFAGRPGLRFHDASITGRSADLNVFTGRADPERYQIAFVREAGGRIYARAPLHGGILLLQASFRRLRRAPASGYERGEVELVARDTICLRTPDGRYAKLLLRRVTPDLLVVEIALQPDGTRIFPAGPAGLRAELVNGHARLTWRQAPEDPRPEYRIWRRRIRELWKPVARARGAQWSDPASLPPDIYEYGVTTLAPAPAGQSDRSVGHINIP